MNRFVEKTSTDVCEKSQNDKCSLFMNVPELTFLKPMNSRLRMLVLQNDSWPKKRKWLEKLTLYKLMQFLNEKSPMNVMLVRLKDIDVSFVQLKNAESSIDWRFLGNTMFSIDENLKLSFSMISTVSGIQIFFKLIVFINNCLEMILRWVSYILTSRKRVQLENAPGSIDIKFRGNSIVDSDVEENENSPISINSDGSMISIILVMKKQ